MLPDAVSDTSARCADLCLGSGCCRTAVSIQGHHHRGADCAGHAARHHQPGDRDRTVGERRLARRGRKQARCRPDDRWFRSPQTSCRRPYHLCDGAAGQRGAGLPAEHAVPARNRLRAGDQDIDLIQRARCESVRAGKIGVRPRHAREEPAGQAQLLVGRLRNAGSSDRRDVQARRRERAPRTSRTISFPRPSPICSAAPTSSCSSPRCRSST